MSGIRIYSKETAKNYDAFVYTLFEGLVIEGKSAEDYILDKLKGGTEVDKNIYVQFNGTQYQGIVDGSTLTLTHPSGTFIGEFSVEDGRYKSSEGSVVFKDNVITLLLNGEIKTSSIEYQPEWWNPVTRKFAKDGTYRIIPPGLNINDRIEITVSNNTETVMITDFLNRVYNVFPVYNASRKQYISDDSRRAELTVTGFDTISYKHYHQFSTYDYTYFKIG